MASVGSVVYGSDYNAVRVKVVRVLGTGSPDGPGTASPTYGYNQSLLSSTVAATQLITQTQWQNLADDINTVIKHQTNANFGGYGTISGVISYSNLNTLDTIINTGTTNRLTVAAGQLAATLLNTNTYGSAWGASGARGIQTTLTLTFSSTTNMQYYFNQGGKLVVQGIQPTEPYSGGTTTQNNNWKALLNGWSYTLNATTFATLGGTFTQIDRKTETATNYTTNYIKLEGSVSGAVISLRVSLWDQHTASGSGPDGVNAGAGYSITGSSATGAFTGVPNPTHAISSAWAVITVAP